MSPINLSKESNLRRLEKFCNSRNKISVLVELDLNRWYKGIINTRYVLTMFVNNTLQYYDLCKTSDFLIEQEPVEKTLYFNFISDLLKKF